MERAVCIVGGILWTAYPWEFANSWPFPHFPPSISHDKGKANAKGWTCMEKMPCKDRGGRCANGELDKTAPLPSRSISGELTPWSQTLGAWLQFHSSHCGILWEGRGRYTSANAFHWQYTWSNPSFCAFLSPFLVLQQKCILCRWAITRKGDTIFKVCPPVSVSGKETRDQGRKHRRTLAGKPLAKWKVKPSLPLLKWHDLSRVKCNAQHPLKYKVIPRKLASLVQFCIRIFAHPTRNLTLLHIKWRKYSLAGRFWAFSSHSDWQPFQSDPWCLGPHSTFAQLSLCWWVPCRRL